MNQLKKLADIKTNLVIQLAEVNLLYQYEMTIDFAKWGDFS
jgi:hypothetical protein